MPIRIQCKCGKSLAVKDQFAGKTVKCPGCGQPLRVPEASGGQTAGGSRPASGKPAAPAAKPAPAAASVASAGFDNSMDELFDEEGFGSNITSVCPACGSQMAAEAVLCTRCGFNKATGEKVQGHSNSAGDISAGAMALDKAAEDMRAADKMQRDLTEGAGMPWWMLALILFILGSATALAVMAVMSANQTTGTLSFNAMKTFLVLAGTGCTLVAVGAFLKLVVEGFKQDKKTGLLCLTVLYLFVFVFQKPKGRIGPLLVLVILGGIAGALFAQSQRV
jgi:hypothetical protein